MLLLLLLLLSTLSMEYALVYGSMIAHWQILIAMQMTINTPYVWVFIVLYCGLV